MLNGVGRLQLSTGGYDVSQGNTNSGVVNVISKRGTFPGSGQATARVNSPNFDHRLAFDYGNATPDNRFSYYVSYQGIRAEPIYGDNKTFYPRLLGQTSYEPGDDTVANLFYHWGPGNINELQYYADAGSNLFNTELFINPALTPYATANGVVQIVGGLGTLFTSPAVSLIDFAPLFPGQAALNQNTGYPDHEDENHQVQKINFKHQFSPSSFGELRAFRLQTDVNFLYPWDLGAFADEYEYDRSDSHGVAFDYSNQLNSQHELTVGGETIFTKPNFAIALPSTTLFTDPLECGQACFDLGDTSNFNTNAPPGFTYVQPLYNEVAAFYGLPAATVPLRQLPDNASHITDTIHRNNLWIRDRWQPNSHWTVTAGVRWDQEILELPKNASQLNTFYANDAAGNFIDVAGQSLGTDVTRPSQISPRIALSYQANSRDVFKASYGKFIEFTPLSNIENTYAVEPSAANCTIANGCFVPLPGYSPTCVNGVDRANGNAGCNSISNLHQQIIEDLNTNNFAQFTPVRPQRATSVDFSWEHDFGNGLQLKISPYYRKGVDYVVASTPLLFNLPDGTSVFGSPRESNAGINKNTGVEFALDKNSTYGFSGFIHATYDNTLANYDSDFFPSVNEAAVALGHLFHVSYLAPVTATLNINYNARNGWHVFSEFPYESGYHYGVGKHTFVYLPTGTNGSLQPQEVLNTDLAQDALGNNHFTSAYYFTDPNNPGTLTNPNITGSRGTNDGNDPGTIRGPQRLFANITLAHDIGVGQKNMQVGLRVANLFGNYTNAVVGNNSRFRPNGFGGFGPTSGKKNAFLAANEPYQFNRGPFPFENEPTGPAREYTLYLTAKY